MFHGVMYIALALSCPVKLKDELPVWFYVVRTVAGATRLETQPADTMTIVYPVPNDGKYEVIAWS